MHHSRETGNRIPIAVRSLTSVMRLALAIVALLVCTTARAQTAADLAPDAAGVFVQIDDAAAIRKAFQDDPLVKYIRSLLPNGGNAKGWTDLQNLMQMDGPQIIDRFFGKSVAFVAEGTGDGKPWMLMTRIDAADEPLVVSKLNLQYLDTVNGFKAYRTADQNARMAFGKGWMVVADRRHEKIIGDVLKQVEGFQPLSKNAQFNDWLAKLPADRTGVAYLHDSTKGEAHAVALVRRDRDLTLHYAGQSPQFDDIYALLGDGKALDFGPLPASTLAAASLNLGVFKPQDTRLIDRVIAPRTFEKDIAPKLGSPMVWFVGRVAPDGFAVKPEVPLPAIGVAIRLRDRTIAADFDRVLDSLVTVANVSTIEWQVAPITLQYVTHGKDENATVYRVADVGTMLSQRTKRSELAPIRLAYGRVGDWYVICSQDAFFKECLAVSDNPTLGLTQSTDFTSLGLRDAQRPVGAAFIRAQPTADMLQTWIDYWQANRPQIVEQAADTPTTPEGRFVRGVTILTTILNHHDSLTAQVERDEQGNARATVAITRHNGE